MPFPPITEQFGSRSASGFALESVFGTAVAATAWLPMTGNTMEVDPGWFSPQLMMATRDLQVFNLYGEYKLQGTVTGPLFPSNAMMLTAASIGNDAAPGFGVTGTVGSGSTTLNGSTLAGATSITVTSAAGFSTNQIIQIDTNNPTTPTTTECVKITNIVSNTITVSPALFYPHATTAPVVGVVAPYTHTFTQQNTLPSLTVEKNLGSFQSLQFAGCRIGKMTLKCPTANQPVEGTWDFSGRVAAILNSPTAIGSAIVNENPWVFSEASLSLFSNARADISNLQLNIDNGLKESWTFSGNPGPSFISPVTLHVNGSATAVWSSLNNSTYGDYTSMVNGTVGALSFSVTHPASAGAMTITLPQVVISKYGNEVKMTDVIMSNLTFEASKSLSLGYTIQATVLDATYTPFSLL
jgi:hypothetical protein